MVPEVAVPMYDTELGAPLPTTLTGVTVSIREL